MKLRIPQKEINQKPMIFSSKIKEMDKYDSLKRSLLEKLRET